MAELRSFIEYAHIAGDCIKLVKHFFERIYDDVICIVLYQSGNAMDFRLTYTLVCMYIWITSFALVSD